MTYDEIRAALKERGTTIGDYQQAALVGKAAPALQGHISEGFCAGAAVDWLRCVLQGGAADHRPDVTMAGVAFLAQAPHSGRSSSRTSNPRSGNWRTTAFEP